MQQENSSIEVTGSPESKSPESTSHVPIQKSLIIESLWNILAFIIILIIALGLNYFGDWCTVHKYPEYIIWGVKIVEVMLFIADCIVMISVAILLGLKLVIKAWKQIIKAWRQK